MNKSLRPVMLAAAIGLAASACLSKDTSNTLYLDPDGAVTWSILHRNVRSDPAVEELEYMSAVVRDDHGVTRGLRALGALDVSTQVLRTIRPFSVLAEGRFTGIDVLGQRLLDACGVLGASTLRYNPDGSLSWILTVTGENSSEDPGEDADALSELFDGHITIVLTRGRFLAAKGFEIGSDQATLMDDDEGGEHLEGLPITICLTWTTRDK